jgi:hypothetical protein
MTDNSKNWIIGALIAVIVFLIIKKPETRPDLPHDAEAPSVPTESTAPEANSLEINLSYKTLNEALNAYVPMMSDFAETEVSKGALLLAAWSSNNLNWENLNSVNSSKYKLMMKDSDSERGKRLCVSGQIVEIAKEKSDTFNIYSGGLVDNYFNIYRFIAVKDTGDLVAGSHAKFCGIFTGKNDYSNSQGGVAHSVHLIGIFDLPSNK